MIPRFCNTLVFLLILSKKVHSQMKGFIVKGSDTYIEKYPHSAFLEMNCIGSWVCGSSIINQLFLLTAGHCVTGCTKGHHISVIVGHTHRTRGLRTSGRRIYIHKNYNEVTMQADIALVMVKTKLPLQEGVKRVALMTDPPPSPPSKLYLAGWGLENEDKPITSIVLKETRQMLVSRENCTKVITRLSPGCICATGPGYAARGDSGSALVADGYIQVGLVSYKMKGPRRDLVVYTDVSYYYDWIVNNTRNVYCGRGKD